jgi:malonyl-CoA/methylmalonyl-CoA synthetase
VTSRTNHPPLIVQALQHSDRTAIVDSQGSFTYHNLLGASLRVARVLLAGRENLCEERVAFQITPGFRWVAVQWGIWRAGGIAVPLPLKA